MIAWVAAVEASLNVLVVVAMALVEDVVKEEEEAVKEIAIAIAIVTEWI